MAWPHGRSRDGGIDEIPLDVTTGRLFLCGKHAVGPDPDAALERAGATTIVCLNDVSELMPRYPEYVEWLRRNATSRAVHHPVHDMHAPTLTEFDALIVDLHVRLLAGERLLVTCGAGIGRAGTVAVGVVIRLGSSLDDALDIVRAHRPMAGPEVGTQLELLAEYARQRR
jgi:protein-tyrosine phosphatase